MSDTPRQQRAAAGVRSTTYALRVLLGTLSVVVDEERDRVFAGLPVDGQDVTAVARKVTAASQALAAARIEAHQAGLNETRVEREQARAAVAL